MSKDRSDVKVVSVDIDRINDDPTFMDDVYSVLSLGATSQDTHEATVTLDDGKSFTASGGSKQSALEEIEIEVNNYKKSSSFWPF